MCDWVKVNQLAINPDKTKYMIFHNPQRKIKYFSLSVDGNIIDRVDTFNSLGLIIYKHLTWKAHINNIYKKNTIASPKLLHTSMGA